MSGTGLLGPGADVPWPDADAVAAAHAWSGRTSVGRLASLVVWLAGAAGAFPPPEPKPRLLHIGRTAPVLPGAFDDLAVTLVEPEDLAAGAAAADRAVDSGADVLLVSGSAGPDACALAVSVLTGAEPVAVLPRGAAAVDTAAWIARAVRLRDGRPALLQLRNDPDALLAALGDAAVATATGLVATAAARRTPLLLDGELAVTAALLAHRAQSRCADWWRVADTSTSPLYRRALDTFGQPPVLDLGIETADGTAAALALAVLRTAAAVSSAARSPGATP